MQMVAPRGAVPEQVMTGLRVRVEAAGRLVRQQNRRRTADRAGDRDGAAADR
jgi:hypothetical protein